MQKIRDYDEIDKFGGELYHGLNSYLCTYDLYVPVHNASGSIRHHPLQGQVGGGWALEIETFLGTVKWIRAYRESDTRISTSGFFHKSVSPGPLSIPLGPFRIFSKIRGDNRE